MSFFGSFGNLTKQPSKPLPSPNAVTDLLKNLGFPAPSEKQSDGETAEKTDAQTAPSTADLIADEDLQAFMNGSSGGNSRFASAILKPSERSVRTTPATSTDSDNTDQDNSPASDQALEAIRMSLHRSNSRDHVVYVDQLERQQAGAPSDASGGKGLKRASSSGKIGPMERARSARSRVDPSLSSYSSPRREMVPSVGSVPLASVACSDISWPAEGDGGGGPPSERAYAANIDPHSFQYAHQGALRALPSHDANYDAYLSASCGDYDGRRGGSFRSRRASCADLAASIDSYRTKLDAPAPDAVAHEQHHDEYSCNKTQFAHGVAWVTFALFTLGALVLLLMWMFMAVEQRHAFVATFFVCTIASCAYFAKCTGMGEAQLFGRVVPLARYIDWVATTPLMLYELCHIGGADSSTTLMVVGCDILMMVAGIFSACLDRSTHHRVMTVWFVLGCVFYVIMLYTLHKEVANGTVLEKSEAIQELFHHLESLMIVLWSLYPVVVFLGRAQCHLISKSTEDAMLCVLDCVSKLGMEGLIVAYCGFIVEPSGSGSDASSH